ncbi:hypothetical protein [Kangiella sp. TOML190]|uniref:hypothetical protein n=1 Tax=Kangiella sp. TOML190 TaxID=2931351 RepID=UPI0020412C54|nr:hypothetical protein [Kangiella sp. TOML190]
MSLKKVFLATTLALSSSLVLADNVSYDYVDLGYQDYDGADGFAFELSKSFSADFYGRLDYTNLEADNSNIDIEFLRLNLGYKMPISSSTDFIAELGYEDIDVDFLGDDDGFNARLGLRGMATRNFELGGFVSYSDVLESTDLTVEGRYHINNQFSVALEVGNDEELDEHYGVSFRYNF